MLQPYPGGVCGERGTRGTRKAGESGAHRSRELDKLLWRDTRETEMARAIADADIGERNGQPSLRSASIRQSESCYLTFNISTAVRTPFLNG